jgi:DNA-binding NtrC family response regulator
MPTRTHGCLEDAGATPDGKAGGLAAACASLGLVGRSPAFRAALQLAERFAAFDAPVLIRGRTGNGKELFARALHYLGCRRARPFVPVNCGALPDTLVESELFGHVRGAFTDARGGRLGLVALAAGGTLFLDEVDSLSPRAQVALLRFLQDHEYRPVGGDKAERANLRVLAATNADLAQAVAAGRFRQDLLFRLDVLGLDLVPLAERREDIALLARHFLARFAAQYGGRAAQLEPEGEIWLENQPWPGNVRELENRLHRAHVLATRGRIGLPELDPVGDGSARAVQAAPRSEGLREARARERRAFEDRYLRSLIAETGGNVSEAARRAGTERRAMGRLLKRYGIEKEAFRD